MEMEKLLRLNLQYFADGEGGEPKDKDADRMGDPEIDPDSPEGGEKTDPEGGEPEGGKDEDKVFTQEEVNRLIQKRLERDRKKREEEAEEEKKKLEREKLQEQEKYKELATELERELEELKNKSLQSTKEAMLAKAGYTEEQVERYQKYLDGETEEELKTSLEQLKEDIPPKQGKDYADPSAGNGQRKNPDSRDKQDTGKSAYQRLKKLGRIK